MEVTGVPESEQERIWGRNRKDILRRFYTKYLNVEGIAIIGSDNVDDNIFFKAKDIVLKVTSKHLQFRRDLSVARLMLVAPRSRITDLPELEGYHDFLYGSTLILKGVVKFCATVVELEGRPNMGVFTHELGHAIVPTINKLEPNFKNLIDRAYEQAVKLGTWRNEKISECWAEYWAEGVKLWTHDVGTDRRFETKDAFKEHDPGLAGILDNWLPVGNISYGY